MLFRFAEESKRTEMAVSTSVELSGCALLRTTQQGFPNCSGYAVETISSAVFYCTVDTFRAW